MDTVVAYIALGSNLGDRAANLRGALEALRAEMTVEAASPWYETEPAYVPDQPRFYNLVCRASTWLTPMDLFRTLKRLEAALGRQPGLRFGPRVIDLDLLFYDSLALDTPELILPHPRLHERAFVLVPLADLAPDLAHPVLGVTVSELLGRLSEAERKSVWPVEGLDVSGERSAPCLASSSPDGGGPGCGP